MPQRHSRRKVLVNAVSAGASALLGGRLFARAIDRQATQDENFDVIVIGSGAAGMTAALTAAKRGLRAVVIEKAPKFGGSTARSGAGIWVRCNDVILKAGVPDSPEQAAAYLARVVGPDIAADRQEAFLANGPAMIDFVMRNSPLRFKWMAEYADYYPDLDGAMTNGASIEPEAFDGKRLGAELANLNDPYIASPPGVVIQSADYRWLSLAAVSAKGREVAAKCIARYAKGLFRGQTLLTMGQALAAGLRAGLLDADVPVWLNTALVDFEFDARGRVTGVIAQKNGKLTQIRATRGVIVCSGGFEHNLAMRLRYQRQPIGTDWTVGNKTNTGDGIQLGIKAGAAVDLMDEAWWGPTIPFEDQPYFCLAERSLPGGIIVNGEGLRFVNEAAPYPDVVNAMYAAHADGSAIPSWLIVDQNFRNRYLFKDVLPGFPLPQSWYASGAVFKDRTLKGLAAKIGVPGEALSETVTRFNGFAKTGQDLDFARGEDSYQRYYADPEVRPNPSLGPVQEAPFYAFKIVPGDLGTKGGLRTDARARVLRADGSVISGLYAAGNASGSVMGRSYPAAGGTLGPAMTFAYIAGNDLADDSLE